MKGPCFLLVLLVEIAVTACNQVDVQQANSAEGIVDLTSEDPIVISWNSTAFGPNITHLAVKLHILGSSNQDPLTVDGIILKVIEKADNFIIYGSDIYKYFEGQVSNAYNAVISVWSGIKSRCKKFIENGTSFFGKVFGLGLCLNCSSCESYNDILRSNEPDDVGPCPCTKNETMNDKQFEVSNTAISFFHPGASSCFRSAKPTSTGSGQQCCYHDGLLLVGPRGGGSADRFSPNFSMLKHLKYDVRPWCGCCHCSDEDADCNKYYKYRPSNDCRVPRDRL